MIWKTCKDSRRRQAVHKKCEQCGKSFIALLGEVKKGRGKFCSTDCFFKSRKRAAELSCAFCKTTFSRSTSAIKKSKSGLRFCSKKCKGAAQRLGTGFDLMLPPHYGTSKINYRSKFDGAEMKCSRCGYDEFSCSVEVHHIDGNHHNNTTENLQLLCANCHRGWHNNLWKAGVL